MKFNKHTKVLRKNYANINIEWGIFPNWNEPASSTKNNFASSCKMWSIDFQMSFWTHTPYRTYVCRLKRLWKMIKSYFWRQAPKGSIRMEIAGGVIEFHRRRFEPVKKFNFGRREFFFYSSLKIWKFFND